MGIAASAPSSTSEYGPCDERTVALRQRGFEFLDFIDPGRGCHWSQHAYFLYRRGGGVERARPVFRAAVARCADYHCVYGFWISMEKEEEEGSAAARELFEEWRARCEADGGDGGNAAGRAMLWARYIEFELKHGGADRARAVAAAAMAACPQDTEVRAECVLTEVKLGDDERARAAFERALADFAADAEAARQLTEKVRRRGAYLSEQWFGGGGCLSFCRRWWFRPQRWWEQI